MKNILIFLFSSIVGFITCFAILYWLFHFELRQSLISSTGAFIGGSIGMAGYYFFLKRKTNRNTKSTSE